METRTEEGLLGDAHATVLVLVMSTGRVVRRTHVKTLSMPDEVIVFLNNMATKDGMKSSVSVDPVRAVLIYENLRQGKSFGGEDLKLVWSFLRPNLVPETAPVFDPLTEYTISDLQSTGFVADASWLDALSISGAMQSYIRALRARGESLKKPPRITCSTIHGVKGGEADNVVIDQKLSSRTFKSWSNADPQEVRALFTAMSRARERLIFLEAKTASSYQVERILSP